MLTKINANFHNSRQFNGALISYNKVCLQLCVLGSNPCVWYRSEDQNLHECDRIVFVFIKRRYCLTMQILYYYSPSTVAVDVSWRPKISEAILVFVSNPQQFEAGWRPHCNNTFAETWEMIDHNATRASAEVRMIWNLEFSLSLIVADLILYNKSEPFFRYLSIVFILFFFIEEWTVLYLIGNCEWFWSVERLPNDVDSVSIGWSWEITMEDLGDPRTWK